MIALLKSSELKTNSEEFPEFSHGLTAMTGPNDNDSAAKEKKNDLQCPYVHVVNSHRQLPLLLGSALSELSSVHATISLFLHPPTPTPALAKLEDIFRIG